MLLVETPDRDDLIRILEALLDDAESREAVVTWQQAIASRIGWSLPLSQADGYWVFYSLALAATPFPGDYFLRENDLREHLSDLRGVPGRLLDGECRQLRTSELDIESVRWPLTVIRDEHDLMSRIPGVRGVFEQNGDMVEHCHLEYAGEHFLLVKDFDEQTDEILLLGASRNSSHVDRLLQRLESLDHILP